MPRDVSGNYTLPIGNPVVDGTIIDVAWANPTMSDIATQLNNVITRDGVLGATNPIKFASGSAAAPSITFTADPALGFYRAGTNILGFSTAGTSRGQINATGNWTIPVPSSGTTLAIASIAGINGVTISDGTKTIAFQTSSGAFDTGLGSSTNHALNLITNNTARVNIAAAGSVTINAPSSGTALTFPMAASGLFAMDLTASAAGFAGLRIAGNANSLGTTSFDIFQSGTSVASIVQRANAALDFYTNNLLRGSWLAAGGLNIATPSSGVALSVNAVASGIGINVSGVSTNIRVSDTGAAAAVVQMFASNTVTGIDFSWATTPTPGAIRLGGVDVLSISTSRGVTIAAPSSGVGLTQTGFAGSDTALFNGGTSGSFRVTDRGLPYGTSIHNNAGAVTGTVNQYIASGTYTPTLTNSVNVSGSVARVCQWIRVGNVVTVSGSVNLTFTAGGSIDTQLGISFPISSNIANTFECAGVASVNNFSAHILGSVVNDRAILQTLSALGAVAVEMYFTFTYMIL